MAKVDEAGRAIAGLLTYNPGPGIYSRLERAIQQMPESVRVQELPGLMKRYKEGVPGWELKATDLDSVIAGRDVVPREDLLAAVRERSPVYTHKEYVLGGNPPTRPASPDGRDGDYDVPVAVKQGRLPRVGEGTYHGEPVYNDYGHGGKDYAELLVLQPGAFGVDFGSHWTHRAPSAVAHARYDIHGDALRINELQSDLGIHNRKAREAMADFVEGQPLATQSPAPELPFPLEDAWADLLVKRLALEAARQGHRAIEVASPRAIADKVGGNIDNYEHFYGKVVPGALERLGRKMGGMVDDTDPNAIMAARRATGQSDDADRQFTRVVELGSVPGLENRAIVVQQRARSLMSDLGKNIYWERPGKLPRAAYPVEEIKRNIAQGLADIVGPERMNEMYLRAEELASAHAARQHALDSVTESPFPATLNPPGKRYLMSDEMRRRLIEGGVGAAIGAGVMSQDDLIDRLNQ